MKRASVWIFFQNCVFQAINAWVLEVYETHRILQLKSHPKSSVQRNLNLPLILLQDCHLTKLISAIEGNLLLKFHALPPPTQINNLLSEAQSPISEKGSVSLGLKSDNRTQGMGDNSRCISKG
jgi:hypothetical protein